MNRIGNQGGDIWGMLNIPKPSSQVLSEPEPEPEPEAEVEEQTEPCLEAWYDATKNRYYLLDGRGRWSSYSESAYKLRLRAAGFDRDVPRGANTSPLEDELIRVQKHCSIEYAGSLPGHQPGIIDVQGSRFLVTDGPNLITPEGGDCSVTLDWLRLLLGDQLDYFLLWLKFGDEAIRNSGGRLGHVLVLAGPPQSGKSRIQELVITPVCGGRVAKPQLFVSGASSFNSDMYKGEHLMGEDEISSTSYEARLRMLDSFKALAANVVHQFHAKGREAMTLAPIWRYSYSLNDEGEALRALPPVTSAIRDKVSLLYVKKVDQWPMPVETGEGYRAFKEQIQKELPAFLWHIQNNVKAPVAGDANYDKRYGVRAIQNKALLALLNEHSPQAHLESLLDGIYFPPGQAHSEKRKRSSEIVNDLAENHRNIHQINKTLASPGGVGALMARLVEEAPERYSMKKLRGNRQEWIIKPPPNDEWLGVRPNPGDSPHDATNTSSALI